MIIDALSKKIQEMKSLRRLELLRDHRTQQNEIDSRYRALVVQVRVFAKALKYARDNCFFPGFLSQSGTGKRPLWETHRGRFLQKGEA